MPRGRGGARQGQPGKVYPNRSDLNAQPVQVPPARQYGDATRQQAAQQAIPLPDISSLPALNAPSGRPGEPVTAGLGVGAGAGPEALAFGAGGQDQALVDLKRLYTASPSDGLRRIIERLEGELGLV